MIDVRLGRNGADEIKKHIFFKGIDWNNITKAKAPFIPEVSSPWDSSYFDKFDEIEPFYPDNTNVKKGKKVRFILKFLILLQESCFSQLYFQKRTRKSKTRHYSCTGSFRIT